MQRREFLNKEAKAYVKIKRTQLDKDKKVVSYEFLKTQKYNKCKNFKL